MSEPHLESFSVSPYDEAHLPVVASPRRPLSSRSLPMLWLIPAALATLAIFNKLYTVRLSTDLSNGGDSLVLGYSLYASGRFNVISNSQSGDFGLAGPRYGVLFGACAVLMLVALLASLLPGWSRRLPSGPSIGLAGSLLLAGVTAAVGADLLSTRHQFDNPQRQGNFSTGPSIWLATAASIIGIGIRLADRMQRDRVAMEAPPAFAGLTPIEQIEHPVPGWRPGPIEF